MGVKTEALLLFSLLIVGGGHSTPVTFDRVEAVQEHGRVPRVGQPSASGPYETSWELVNVTGLVSGSYQDAWVVYPSGTEASDKTFPLLSFGTCGGWRVWPYPRVNRRARASICQPPSP